MTRVSYLLERDARLSAVSVALDVAVEGLDGAVGQAADGAAAEAGKALTGEVAKHWCRAKVMHRLFYFTFYF